MHSAGVVLQCYGAGNVPNNRTDVMDHLKDATDRGVLILSVTQCINGSVSGLYATGKALLDIGIIPGECNIFNCFQLKKNCNSESF